MGLSFEATFHQLQQDLRREYEVNRAAADATTDASPTTDSEGITSTTTISTTTTTIASEFEQLYNETATNQVEEENTNVYLKKDEEEEKEVTVEKPFEGERIIIDEVLEEESISEGEKSSDKIDDKVEEGEEGEEEGENIEGAKIVSPVEKKIVDIQQLIHESTSSGVGSE